MPTINMSHARLWLAATSVAAAVLLTACGRPDDTTARNPSSDTAVSDAGRAINQAGNEVRQEARETGQAVADTAKDAAITTEVNTLLAGDDQLSALKIDVDTNAGQVVLQGTAPNEAARSRAADLARSVGGVITVDNQLQLARN